MARVVSTATHRLLLPAAAVIVDDRSCRVFVVKKRAFHGSEGANAVHARIPSRAQSGSWQKGRRRVAGTILYNGAPPGPR